MYQSGKLHWFPTKLKKIMRSPSLSVLFGLVFAILPFHLTQGGEIPAKLQNVSVYDYIDNLRKQSSFYNEVFPESGRQLNVKLQAMKAEGDRFCNYYWKFQVLPRMYKEYIVFDNGEKQSTIVLTYNITDSSDCLTGVLISDLDSFISENLLDFLRFLSRESGDSKIDESCRNYSELLHLSLMEKNFDDFSMMVEADIKSAAGFSSRDKEREAIEGISRAMKLLNVINERFDLTAEKQYLGCYQISSKTFSACLLIHTEKCGYGVVSMLMESNGTEVYMRNLTVVFNESLIFRNLPTLLKNTMP